MTVGGTVSLRGHDHPQAAMLVRARKSPLRFKMAAGPGPGPPAWKVACPRHGGARARGPRGRGQYWANFDLAN
jgi:hypothetical protein